MILHHAHILMATHLRPGDIFYTTLELDCLGKIVSAKNVAGGTTSLTYDPIDEDGNYTEAGTRRLSIPGNRLVARVIDLQQ